MAYSELTKEAYIIGSEYSLASAAEDYASKILHDPSVAVLHNCDKPPYYPIVAVFHLEETRKEEIFIRAVFICPTTIERADLELRKWDQG